MLVDCNLEYIFFIERMVYIIFILLFDFDIIECNFLLYFMEGKLMIFSIFLEYVKIIIGMKICN